MFCASAISFLAASCWLCYKFATQDREIETLEKEIQLAAIEFNARTHNFQVWTPIEQPPTVSSRHKPSGNFYETHAGTSATHPIVGNLEFAAEGRGSPSDRSRRLL